MDGWVCVCVRVCNYMFVRFLLLCRLAHPHFCFRAMAASGDTGHALGMSWLAGACFRAWQELVGGVGRLRDTGYLEDGLFSAASDDGFISPSVAIDDSILEPKTAVAAVDHRRLYDEPKVEHRPESASEAALKPLPKRTALRQRSSYSRR